MLHISNATGCLDHEIVFWTDTILVSCVPGIYLVGLFKVHLSQ